MTNVSYSMLHFDNDSKPKSFMGGMACIIVELYVTYIVFNNAIKMVNKSNPKIMSIVNGINFHDPEHDDSEVVHIVNASKPLF